MAARDIMPFTSSLGGSTTVKTAGMTAAQTFATGEPVGIVTAGTVTEGTAAAWDVSASDMDVGLQAGIACYGPGNSTNNPKTNTTWASNDEVAFWPINEGTVFINNGGHFWAIGSPGTEAVPDITDIGMAYQLSSDGTDWGVEQTIAVTGTDVRALILDVLDAQRDSIRNSGNAGAFVIFELTATLAAP